MFHPNYVQIRSLYLAPNFGYARTPTRYVPRCNALAFPTEIIANQKKKSTVLWPCLFAAWPNWLHGLQATGDCVSWAHSHMADITDAIRNIGSTRITELLRTASEPTYAFGKCELQNSYHMHSAGMMGLDAILATEKFGRLFRKKYEKDDLTNYDGSRAELWAEDPRSTHGVPDYLEPEAAQHKFTLHLEITDGNTAAAFIEAGYPVGYCGNTKWGLATDDLGYASEYSSGAHAMALTGVEYRNGEAFAFWNANTGHGDHVEYNVPNSSVPKAYRECGCWLPRKIVADVLVKGDCFALSPHGEWNVHELPAACTDETNLR
jgi:hypothetical protein